MNFQDWARAEQERRGSTATPGPIPSAKFPERGLLYLGPDGWHVLETPSEERQTLYSQGRDHDPEWRTSVSDALPDDAADGTIIYREDGDWHALDPPTEDDQFLGTTPGPTRVPRWAVPPAGEGGASDVVAATALGKNHASFDSRLGVPLIYDEDYYWWWVPLKFATANRYEDGAMPGWSLVDHMSGGALPGGYGTILIPPADALGTYMFGVNSYMNLFASTDNSPLNGVPNAIDHSYDGHNLEDFPLEASLVLIGKNADGDSDPNWGEFYSEFDYPITSLSTGRIAIGNSFALNGFAQALNVGRPDNDPDDGARSVYGFGFAVRDGHGGSRYKVRRSHSRSGNDVGRLSGPAFGFHASLPETALDLSGGPLTILWNDDLMFTGPSAYDAATGFYHPPHAGQEHVHVRLAIESGHVAGDEFLMRLVGSVGSYYVKHKCADDQPFIMEIDDTFVTVVGGAVYVTLEGTAAGVTTTPVDGSEVSSTFGSELIETNLTDQASIYGLDGTPTEGMAMPAFTATYFQLQAHRVGPGLTGGA